MTTMRCIAELTIQVPGTAVHVELWPGVEVDVDREIAPATKARPPVTIASAVGGAEGLALYFEPVAKPAKAAAPKKVEE